METKTEKIPHIIHYCWFGGGRKPPGVRRYIENWKKMLPGYQFMEWNEENFRIAMFPFAEKAWLEKKYAFVSDVARVWALYVWGGIYLDTDVEVVRDFSDCLEGREMVLGFEEEDHLMTAFMAAVPGHLLLQEMLDYYAGRTFGESGSADDEANPIILSRLADRRGLVRDNRRQILEGEIEVFPAEYFSAYRLRGEEICATENTYTVHHFSGSWKPWSVRFRKNCKYLIRGLFGQDMLDMLVENGRRAKSSGRE